MDRPRRFKIGIGIVFLLIVLLVPTAALRADNTTKPMMSHDFTDVPVVGQEFMEPYIDAFYHQQITGGCSMSPLQYCPTNSVTRGSMAVFMGRALGYVDMVNDGYKARAYFKQTDTGFDDHGVIGATVNGSGVMGISEDGYGVHGISVSSLGVLGQSSNDFGVLGSSTTWMGVMGTSTSGIGVYGDSSDHHGVVAISDNASALVADTASQSVVDSDFDVELGGSNGELFGSTLNFFSNAGVLVNLDNDNNSTSTFTVFDGNNAPIFRVDETGSVHTAGTITAAPSIGIGVQGLSVDDYAVSAESLSDSAIYAEAGANSSSDAIFDIVLGGALGDIRGSLLHLFSDDDFTIDLDNNDDGAGDVFSIRDGDNNVVFSVTEAGTMFASGSKSAIVDTVSYGTRAMYAVEATEVLFEDVGSAELVDGVAVIEFDPIFAETVNLNEPYQVFLTPVGGWAELYIVEKTDTHFEVRSTDPLLTITFDYRIVAKRLGYEDVRMEEVTP